MDMTKKIIAVLIAAALALFATGCAKDNAEEPFEEIPAMNVADENMRQTVLYLEDDFGYIVPVMKEIEWVEGIGKAAVSQLIADPDADAQLEYMGLNPILAEGTEVSLSIKEGVATIQLSEGAIAAEDAVGEMNKVVAVVNTLCEFPTIDSVVIRQAGREDALPCGTDISAAFAPFDLNVATTTLSSEDMENASKILLYFGNGAETAIVPVTKFVGGEADAFVVMSELVKGPGGGSLKNLFPEGTQLLGVDVDETGVATVNFSSELSAVSKTPELQEKLVKCIMLSLKQFDNIDEVVILVEGKEFTASSEATMAYMEFVNTME
jgi:Spore germination protein